MGRAGRTPGLPGVLAVLAVAQIIGWGTVVLLTVVGNEVAADLDMSLAEVFAGSTAFYVVMGLISPLVSRPLQRFGPRLVMLAGSVAAAPAFLLLSLANGPAPYFLGWIVLGAAGAASLNTAAYVLVSDVAGIGARWALGVLMMATGLSSSIFWPVTAVLSSAFGWRGTCLVFAGLILFVSIPLYAFTLPRRAGMKTPGRPLSATGATPPLPRRVFWFLTAAIALNAFVTFGFSALFVELLKARGLEQADAVVFASLLGVLQVVARLADFLVGRLWDEVTTALIAGIGLIVALLVLLFGGGSHPVITLFVLLYGLGSGALAVARATMPLSLFDKERFAQAITRIALPLNILSAAAPPVFAALLTGYGSGAVLGVAIFVSLTALLFLVLLARSRRRIGIATLPADGGA